MPANLIDIVDVEGGLVDQVKPPYIPGLQTGQIINIKGREYIIRTLPGSLSAGGVTISVESYPKRKPSTMAAKPTKRSFGDRMRDLFGF